MLRLFRINDFEGSVASCKHFRPLRQRNGLPVPCHSRAKTPQRTADACPKGLGLGGPGRGNGGWVVSSHGHTQSASILGQLSHLREHV